ncbi:Universal stress protein [Senna tora]|uniref:Universal stress protein n=1 Tax=Senna tora TaxID=362788 RepID=A0A835CDB6_9FABA|nr:Universal stress protein [Senna tora]
MARLGLGREAGDAAARKVMVVAEGTRESTTALQYALSHAILEQDELILLQIGNPSPWRNAFSTFLKRPMIGEEGGGGGAGGGGGGAGEGEVDFIEEMKRSCKVAQPNIEVRIVRAAVVEGKDKAMLILSQAMSLGIDVIIIGQRRSLSTMLGYKRGGGGNVRGTRMIDTVEFLIENSPCTCVAVQRKGQAGYLLNTKTHKNFWLLA